MSAIAALALLLLTMAGPVSAVDTDKDGLRDGFEKRWGVTDPLMGDSDKDGVIDSAEDSDGDGLGNLGEQRFGTDPGRRDPDRDGISDAREDRDRDGRCNAREQDQRRVPLNLRPTIGSAKNNLPPIRFGCQTPHGQAQPVTCGFGPVPAHTRVVLFGDSHAMMWSSPVRRISLNKDWRLVTMTKTACPALLGLLTRRQMEIDRGASCQRWRRNVIDKLKANPPDLIIITQSDRYKLYSSTGRVQARSKGPSLWKQALRKTLAALPARSKVLVIGDVPHNSDNPRKCLNHNRNDMSRCVTPKAGPAGRRIEIALKEAARANGADFRTLYGQICSYDPCPVVQGEVLMWRDRGHLTNKFAVVLQPSMRAIMEEALR
jgi:hypothetical protein